MAGRRAGAGEAAGDRPAAGRWTLADALAALAADRSPIRVGLHGGETVTGVLLSVGEDVMTLRLASGDLHAHVALDAIESATAV